MSGQVKSDPTILTGSKKGSWSQKLSSLSQKTKILTNNVITRRFGKYSFFVASWGLPVSFFWLPRDLVSNIINKKAYMKPPKASRKPPGSYKKFQGRNPYNIFVAILVQTMTPKDISIFCILNLTFIIKIKTTLRQNSIVVEVQKILRASICQLNNDQSGCTLSLEP